MLYFVMGWLMLLSGADSIGNRNTKHDQKEARSNLVHDGRRCAAVQLQHYKAVIHQKPHKDHLYTNPNEFSGDPFNRATDAVIEVFHRIYPDPKGMIIADVGANKGFETSEFLFSWGNHLRLLAAKQKPELCNTMNKIFCAPSPVRIHAFEMMPLNAELLSDLSKSFHWGPSVVIHNAAMSDKNGGSAMVCSDHRVGLEQSSLSDKSSSCKMHRDVPIMTLDAFAQSHKIKRFNVIKIDTEGFDARVIKGTEGLLSRGAVDLVVFECCMKWKDAILPADYFGSGHNVLHALSVRASEWGYRMYLLGRRNMLLMSPALYPEPEPWREFYRCGWCNMALVRESPALNRLPHMINMDLNPCLEKALPCVHNTSYLTSRDRLEGNASNAEWQQLL